VIGQESQEVEREKMAIMRILKDSRRPVGSKIIARQLKVDYNINLSERGVRYHLRLLDEKGLTSKVSRRDGRIITEMGSDEIDNAMVSDKVGFAIDKIEQLAFQSTFEPTTLNGQIPVNISFFPKEKFKAALRAMKGVFDKGICVSRLLAIAQQEERLGGVPVPEDKIGIATVCGLVINGALLKAGIPMDSRFGGILQLKKGKPWRFTEIIDYGGTSLDPSEIFISSRMTSVYKVVESGEGKILANFREIPAMCLPLAKKIFDELGEVDIDGLMTIGEAGKPLCEIPVGLNKVGLVLVGGLNPVAAAVESGIEVTNKAMSGLMDFKELSDFSDIK
jgi:repressor of nif and glnA expression